MNKSFIWPLLLCCGLLFTLQFAINNGNQIRLETDLNDLSPNIAEDSGVQTGINQLSSSIANRIILLIEANNRETADNAREQLTQELIKIDNINVFITAEQQQQFIDHIKPFRFQLLNEEQRKYLLSANDDDIASDLKRSLFQPGGEIRIINFTEDPFGFFSDYILTLFDNSQEILEKKSRFYTFIPITILKENLSIDQQNLLNKNINAIVDNARETFSITIFKSGIFFFTVDAAKKAKSDIENISAFSSLVILLLLLFIFRSIKPIGLAFLSILIGLSFAIAITHTVYGSIHIFTIVFGASLIGIVVDYSLHFIYHTIHTHHRKQKPSKALQKSLLLSVATSLIGYGALGFSALQSLEKVAVFSCSGLILSWLSVLVLGPIFTGKLSAQSGQRPIYTLVKWIYFISPKKLSTCIIIIIGIITAFLVFLFLKMINISDDPKLFFTSSPERLIEEQKVAEIVSDYEPGRYLIVKANSIESVYQYIKEFKILLTQHQVSEDTLLSIDQWVPSPQQQRINYQLQQGLFKSGGALSIILESLGGNKRESNHMTQDYLQSQDRELNPTDFINSSDHIPPLWFKTDSLFYSFALLSKQADLDTIEALSLKHPHIQFMNTIGTAEKMLKNQRRAGALQLAIAYLFIAALLALRYRSFSAIAMLLVPIFASMGTILILHASGQAMTVFHIMALFLVLGLGMDYVIFTRDMHQHRHITEQAIMLSAITSLLSFGLLSISDIPVVNAFGSTVFIANSLNLLATFVYSQLYSTLKPQQEPYD